jgi:hypothetical protein
VEPVARSSWRSTSKLTESWKGERAVAIIAPLPVKERDRVTGEETGETMMLFKTVFVFDRAQVDPVDGREQAPLGPLGEPLTGDSHAHLLAPVQVFAESLGFSVSFESIPGETGGWCDLKSRRIMVDRTRRRMRSCGSCSTRPFPRLASGMPNTGANGPR